MDRRAFATLLPALLASLSLSAQETGTMDHPVMGTPTPGPPKR